MKKIFLAFAAVAVMASCQKEMGMAPTFEEFENQAVSFSAYMASSVTRGTIVAGDELNKIGVFAFYQENANGNKTNFNTHKYSAPDFMYNQEVFRTSSSDANWQYSPVKYWPNNKGDQLSFFAYAPYNENKTWEDMGILTDVNGTKMEISFPIYNSVKEQIDYLWANPQVNKFNQASIPDAASGEAVSSKINFTFKHITSRISLYVGVEQETATGNTTIWAKASADASADPNPTTITVESIEFKGLNDKLTLKYTMPICADDVPTTGTGVQDIILSNEAGDFQYASSNAWTEAKFYELLAQEKNKDNQDESGYMFIAPQRELSNLTVIFTYKVETKDNGNLANSSTVINKIERKWSEFAPEITEFVAGSAYKLKFLIGMNTVDFKASETPWSDASEHKVDVPLNK